MQDHKMIRMRYQFINPFRSPNTDRVRFEREFDLKICKCRNQWDGGIQSFEFDYYVGNRKEVRWFSSGFFEPLCPYEYFTNSSSGEFAQNVSSIKHEGPQRDAVFIFHLLDSTKAG